MFAIRGNADLTKDIIGSRLEIYRPGTVAHLLQYSRLFWLSYCPALQKLCETLIDGKLLPFPASLDLNFSVRVFGTARVLYFNFQSSSWTIMMMVSLKSFSIYWVKLNFFTMKILFTFTTYTWYQPPGNIVTVTLATVIAVFHGTVCVCTHR